MAEFTLGYSTLLGAPDYQRLVLPVKINGVEFMAFFDTGAEISSFSPKVADALALTPIPDANMTIDGFAGCSVECKTFMVNLELPNSIDFNKELVEFVSPPDWRENQDVIIGMPVISCGTLNVRPADENGFGSWTFAI